jgi:hypothetical protein
MVEFTAESILKCAVAGLVDPSFSSVKLLLGFQGADGSTGAPGLTDESPAAHGTATAVGNAQIDTAQSKFGGASLLGDGTGDGISFPDSTDWRLSTANSDQFTVEAWVRTSTTTPTDKVIVARSTGVPNVGFFFRCNTSGNGELSFLGSTNNATLDWAPASSSGITWALSTWYHVAADKDATGKVRVYRDGVMVGSSTPTDSSMAAANTAVLTIGIDGLGGRSWDGWIDEVRITKGVARYASDSGYTVPTDAFPRS